MDEAFGLLISSIKMGDSQKSHFGSLDEGSMMMD